MSIADRKIINIFKSFIERVFVPHLPKMDLFSQQEWNKFNNMISADLLNIGEVQLYVDTLPNSGINNGKHNFEKIESKSPVFSKIRRDSTTEQNGTGGFNPSRTFGGERARMMFPLKDFEDNPVDRNNAVSKDFSKDKEEVPSGLTTQMILPTIEKLFKTFSENQNRLERIGQPVVTNQYEAKGYYN